MKSVSMTAAAATLAIGVAMSGPVQAQQQSSGPLKLGVVLPYKGVYASLSEGVDRGHAMAIEEFGGKLPGARSRSSKRILKTPIPPFRCRRPTG